MPSKQSRQAKSIALSKCTRSRTIALFMTFLTHHHHNPKCKNEQHFVWVMVVRCGERSPHKPPVRGEPTMRKGSYSEELVKHQEVSGREREQQTRRHL